MNTSLLWLDYSNFARKFQPHSLYIAATIVYIGKIKFFDRIKAMEKLLEVSDAADSDKDNSFLDAILKGSEMLNQKGDNDNEL